MQGILYGVGLGPGDAELMTVKAIKTIMASPVVAVPLSSTEGKAAWKIAAEMVPDLAEKEILELAMPMTRDEAILSQSRQRAAQAVIAHLQAGRSVAFLTIGDPSIYSTYSYIHQLVVAQGYSAQMIAGVPSFCAVAARLGVSLGQGAEAIHIIPASYAGVDQGLDYDGTKVLMKAGKSLGVLQEKLAERGLLAQAKMVERCGMSDEVVYDDLRAVNTGANYLSTVIVKTKENDV